MINWSSFSAGFATGLAGGSLLRKLLQSVTRAIQGFYRAILDDTRKAFNDRVTKGEFSIRRQIESDAKEFKNQRTLKAWFTEYAKKHSYRGLLVQGHLYYIDFYDPLLKDKLEFYDQKPLVLSFGIYLADTGNLVQTGINLHMLPHDIRIAFVSDVFELFRAQFKGVMYSDKPRKLNEFTWETLKRFIDKYHIDFAVRSYIPERMHNVVMIDYQDWGKALALSGFYIGTNERELVKRYRDFIRNK